MANSRALLRLLSRPSIWVGIISIIAYCDEQSLQGNFVYDDAGSVLKNVVVNGEVPWQEVFTRDFWGTSMSEITSHKSFRPITTLSFRGNWVLNEFLGLEGKHTFQMRLTNVMLHGLVSGLATEASAFVFHGEQTIDLVSQFVTGALFGLHPVHAEVVSNITSRGELLMSLFFFVAFLSFASNISPRTSFGTSHLVGVYMVPVLGMGLSLFSKEQGATTLISLVIYDFVRNHESFQVYFEALLNQDPSSISFLVRTIVLAIQTLVLCGWRYWLNGETSPDFIFDQNPAGFSEDRFTRVFSTSWIYCLYIFDAVFPKHLCPDWSGRSIDLIEDGSDTRIWGVLALWLFAGGCVASLVMGPPDDASAEYKETRKVILMAFLAFLFAPFFLSSNILVVVGLMKADRVIYLPLLGFCMIEAQLFKLLFALKPREKPETNGKYNPISFLQSSGVLWIGQVLILLQLFLLARKTHERNNAWSHSLNLWSKAFMVNPRSHHTMYNCGYELSLKKRYKEAETVMRPIGSARVDGPSNTFVYAMVLYNLNRCDDAHRYIDEAMDVLDEKEQTGGPRNMPHMLARTRSNLLVARAHCTDNIQEKGRIMYEAVQVDQRNEYAVSSATQLMKHIEQIQKTQYDLGI